MWPTMRLYLRPSLCLFNSFFSGQKGDTPRRRHSHAQRQPRQRYQEVGRPKVCLELDDATLHTLSEISERMFRDEAEAVGVDMANSSSKGGASFASGAAAALLTPKSAVPSDCNLEDVMELLMDPCLITRAEGAERHCKSGFGTGLPSSGPSSTTPPSVSGLSKIAGDAASFESDLLALMQLGGRPGGADVAPPLRAATELILQGLDVKALLRSGALHSEGVAGGPLYLREKYLSRCDFSGIQWESVNAVGCDFSRSLFYQASFRGCSFISCCFDGCVLKRASLLGNVSFVDCSFRFAGIGARRHDNTAESVGSHLSKSNGGRDGGRQRGYDSSAAPQRGACLFQHCDFDLSDFEGSEGLNDARLYVDCVNTETAAQFPLRVSARVR